MPPGGKSRLAYIDWMRGLACVLMFQTHCYDSWLEPAARKTDWFMWSQLGGTLPAPLFLFLAGISFALVTDKLRQRGATRAEIAKTTIRRGAEIFALGLLFRVQAFALAWPWAAWTDLLRVDVLNVIGVSMMLMGIVCWLAAADTSGTALRMRSVAAAAPVAIAIPLLTPPLWTTWRLHWLPWPLESYICGVHTYGEPQAWLFPIFPWTGFAFAGLVVGFLLLSEWARRHEGAVLAIFAGSGAALIAAARALDHGRWQLYAVYDFWHTSPNFFFIRVGLLLVILAAIYGWCRLGVATWGFSPLIQLGQTSLLVYWVHIEFVYGSRLRILPSHANSIAIATLGLIFITVAMVVLSRLRTEWKTRGGPARAARVTAAAQ